MAQHVDVADRLTTIGEHNRDVDQHLATDKLLAFIQTYNLTEKPFR